MDTKAILISNSVILLLFTTPMTRSEESFHRMLETTCELAERPTGEYRKAVRGKITQIEQYLKDHVLELSTGHPYYPIERTVESHKDQIALIDTRDSLSEEDQTSKKMAVNNRAIQTATRLVRQRHRNDLGIDFEGAAIKHDILVAVFTSEIQVTEAEVEEVRYYASLKTGEVISHTADPAKMAKSGPCTTQPKSPEETSLSRPSVSDQKNKTGSLEGETFQATEKVEDHVSPGQ